ncbi:hypothetical protein ACFPM3_05300 [Streptomyces coeruleoprunus]|uniref:Uncharacterized protein n=1 Tax=Streptomyces coeruleoprunus TaxID=285563 RepID=A0ABV9X7X5_9ACTN
MNQRTPKDRAEKRSREEPGAHSGRENQPARRDVPGTAGVTEGYRPEEGTAGGQALKGVEAEDTAATKGRADQPTARKRKGRNTGGP